MPMQKLTPQQVAEIRRSYAEGRVTQQELADKNGVCRGHISRVCAGKTGATEPVIASVFRRILDDISQAATGADSL